MTILRSPKLTHDHTGTVAALPPGKRTAPDSWATAERRTASGKMNGLPVNKKHGGGDCSLLPAGKIWEKCDLRVGRFKLSTNGSFLPRAKAPSCWRCCSMAGIGSLEAAGRWE